MIPVVGAAEGENLLFQTRTHLSHATRHVSQVLVPQGGQLGITKDDINDTSTVDGRVGVDWAGDLLDARVNNLFLSWRTSND